MSADKFSISNFRSRVLASEGVLRNNLFLVTINPPAKLVANSFRAGEYLSFLCASASQPGVSFISDDQIRNSNYGPAIKVPYVPSFEDNVLEFLGDGRGSIMKFFHRWMNHIINFNSRFAINSSYNILSNASPYEINYRQDYLGDVTIVIYNESADTIVTTTLREAYPIAMGSIPLNWNDIDQLMRIPVTFTYRDWYSNSESVSNVSDSSIQGLSLIQQIVKTGTAVQTLLAIKKPQSVGDIINIVNNGAILTNALGF
jgi:hypothetical protein